MTFLAKEGRIHKPAGTGRAAGERRHFRGSWSGAKVNLVAELDSLRSTASCVRAFAARWCDVMRGCNDAGRLGNRILRDAGVV